MIILNSIEAKFRPTHALQCRHERNEKHIQEAGLPRSIREWIESFLNCRLVLFEPPLRSEYICIITPNALIPMDGVTGYAENSVSREISISDSQSSFRDQTWETNSTGRVDAQRLVDNGFKVCQTFHLLEV